MKPADIIYQKAAPLALKKAIRELAEKEKNV